MEKESKNLAYWKANAFEDYVKTPISVLRYITELESALIMYGVVGRSEQLFCDCSRGKGVDIDEDGFPYCIDCQKNIAK